MLFLRGPPRFSCPVSLLLPSPPGTPRPSRPAAGPPHVKSPLPGTRLPDSHVVLCSPSGPCSSAPLSVRGFLSAPQDGRQPHHPGRSPASLASARWAPGQLGRPMPSHGSGRWGARGSVCGAQSVVLAAGSSAPGTAPSSRAALGKHVARENPDSDVGGLGNTLLRKTHDLSGARTVSCSHSVLAPSTVPGSESAK